MSEMTRPSGARAHRPQGPHPEQSDRTAAEDEDRLASFDLGHLGSLVTGREGVRDGKCVEVLHVVRDLLCVDADERNVHLLRQPAEAP
jgi:hypothetical protein